ncbi:MAG: diacylglycerol/lipid kinase family protein [Geodermatophilaceae bacterium]
MRALLVVNTAATETTSKTRDVIARALASDLKVDVAETTHRGHAAELGTQALRDGVQLVVALGGDGTVNEVVNGLLVDGPNPHVPALAVVPGGSTNVFSRALGQSRDPVEATAEILEALRRGGSRRISLGRADERWFTFTAGFGFDADVVRRVERLRGRGRVSTASLYIRAAVTQFYLDRNRWRPPITVAVPGEQAQSGFFFCVASNTSPWTYLGTRPVQLAPRACFDSGLDVLALGRTGTSRMLRHAARAVRGREPLRHASVRTITDTREVSLHSTRPMALQVDGDYVGDQETLLLHSVPNALSVVLP